MIALNFDTYLFLIFVAIVLFLASLKYKKPKTNKIILLSLGGTILLYLIIRFFLNLNKQILVGWNIPFNLRGILLSICLILAITLSLLKYKNQKTKRIIALSFGSLIVLFLLVNYLTLPTTSEEFFYQIDIENKDLEDLKILEREQMKVLSYKNNLEVTYIRDGKEYQPKKNSIVYLRDLGSYYLAVYSLDSEKNYDHGRYILSDYESHEHIDRLYFINKKDGKMFIFYDYELIGKTLNLNTIEEIENIGFLYHVLIDFEQEISYAALLAIKQSNAENRDYPLSINIFLTDTHYHGTDYSYIQKVMVNKNKEFVWTDSYGKAYQNTFTVSFTKDSAHAYYGRKKEILEGENYFLQGYWKLKDDGLYYVDNNLKLYKLQNSSKTHISDIIDLEKWEELIN
jgi:hypothetical protein